MPQGKLKVKAKLPANVKNKKTAKKGPSVTKRGNCPIAPKKQKFQEANKLKKIVTKNVNQAVEAEMRNRSGDRKKSFSKVEMVVAAYNKAKQPETTS